MFADRIRIDGALAGLYLTGQFFNEGVTWKIYVHL